MSETIVDDLVQYFLDHVLAVKTLQPNLELKTTNGYNVLVEYITQRVQQGKKILMVLPAFPSKTPNPDKVIGEAPDFCEFTAITKFIRLVKKMEEMYEPGAHLTIFSDYHTFEKYIGVSHETHYVYRQELEEMIEFLDGKDYITVKSLRDFPEFDGKEEEDYQETLRELYGNREFEASVANPEAIKLKMKNCDETFKNNFIGLRSFIVNDQIHRLEKKHGKLSLHQRQQVGNELAAGMMIMGKALTPFLAKHFPASEYFRLSIHAHDFCEGKKFTVLTLPVDIRAPAKDKDMNTSILGVCTPWHTASCFNANDCSLNFKPIKELRSQADVKIKLDKEVEATFKEIFDLLDTTKDGKLQLSELKDVILLNHGGAHHEKIYDDLLDVTLTAIMGEKDMDFEDFLDCIANPRAAELMSEVLMEQISRKQQLSPHQRFRYAQAWSKLKTLSAQSVLLPVSYMGKPWLLLRLKVDRSVGNFHERMERLSSIQASMIKPGYGMLLEAGEAGLFKEDFLPSDLDNIRKEFGGIILRGLEKPFNDTEDMIKMTSWFGFPIPWNFGPVNVIKPRENPRSDVETTEAMMYHFDVCFPPPYMKIDKQKFTYKDYVPGNFFLYCRHAPPPNEGQTTLCDTEAVFNSFSPKVQKQLRSLVVRYGSIKQTEEQYYGGDFYEYPVVMADPEKPDREIMRFVETALDIGLTFQVVNPTSDISDNELKEMIISKYRDKKYTIYHSYHQDDIVFINNHRTIHGREPFSVPCTPRQLWRVQVIPHALQRVSPFWEEYINSNEVKQHLENDDGEWAAKVISDVYASGLKLHHDAIVALFNWMVNNNDMSLWGKLAGCIFANEVSLSDDLALLMADIQKLLPVGWQEDFCKHGTKLLLNDVDGHISDNVRALLWTAVLDASLHMEYSDLSAYINELSPETNNKVPKHGLVCSSVIQIYSKLHDIDRCGKILAALPEIDQTFEFNQTYTKAMVSNKRFSLAIQRAQDSIALANASKNNALMDRLQRSSSIMCLQTRDLYSSILEEAIDDRNERALCDIIAHVGDIPLTVAVVSKLVAYAVDSEDTDIFKFALKQVSFHPDKTFELSGRHLACMMKGSSLSDDPFDNDSVPEVSLRRASTSPMQRRWSARSSQSSHSSVGEGRRSSRLRFSFYAAPLIEEDQT